MASEAVRNDRLIYLFYQGLITSLYLFNIAELYLVKEVYLHTTMDSCLNETVHVISLCRFENTSANKKYKEQKLTEIIIAICAMLNSDGGNVVLHNECDCEKCKSSQMSLVVRMLEQSMISIIGLSQTVSNINFKEDKESIVILVKKSDSLITTNYNLYLPSQSQVVQVSPWEPLEKVKDDIINRKVVEEPVQYDSHCKKFVKDRNCGFQDNKSVQLKHLKAGPSKRTRLADRMTGKGNKFSCYVSAFANYSGGHMYYGIRDDGVVEGELISNEEDIIEITKKVRKAINKMIWPEQIGQPKRGEHWEIFFEPVVDENSNVIPSTFVIVIYIAACVGGVFTEEPECYEMVERKVKKMSFATWKKRILHESIKLFLVDNVSSITRITWSSSRIGNICTFADQLLTQSIDNGDSIQRISLYLEKSFPKMIEVRLVVLSKKVMVAYRSSFFKTARKLLNEYTDLLTGTTEMEIFDAIRAYLETAFCRAQGDLKTRSDTLVHALEKAEIIAPGLMSAAIYLLVASAMDLFQSKDDQVSKLKVSPDALSIQALQHLQFVQDSPIVRADMEQKAHITLALFHLGCNISGQLTRKDIDGESLEKANSSVMAIKKSINEGNEMNNYRDIQFNLVQSVLSYRKSQVQPDRKTLLQEAFNFARKAEEIASEHKLPEMLSWARACTTLCTEDLVRTHFKTHRKSTTHSEPKSNPPQNVALNEEAGTSKSL